MPEFRHYLTASSGIIWLGQQTAGGAPSPQCDTCIRTALHISNDVIQGGEHLTKTGRIQFSRVKAERLCSSASALCCELRFNEACRSQTAAQSAFSRGARRSSRANARTLAAGVDWGNSHASPERFWLWEPGSRNTVCPQSAPFCSVHIRLESHKIELTVFLLGFLFLFPGPET